jgi:hypothetical protein
MLVHSYNVATHIILFKRMYVDMLYILQSSSLYIILHTPLDWVGQNRVLR